MIPQNENNNTNLNKIKRHIRENRRDEDTRKILADLMKNSNSNKTGGKKLNRCSVKTKAGTRCKTTICKGKKCKKH